MNLLQQFTEHIKAENLFSASDPLLIAVSGGIDSIVLCHLCKAAGYSFSIAHCHFGLRGAESDRDADFVKKLSGQLEVECLIKYFDTAQYAADNKISIQVAARELRYQWFTELMTVNKNIRWVLTAHHRDDSVETALMQWCKGTGISGLTGISKKRGVIVRPLLFASRVTIENYAKEKNIEWVEDSSNKETKYLRNHFRHKVLPAIEKVIPQVRNNISDNLDKLNEAHILYMQAIEWHKKKLLERKEAELHISVLKLQKTVPLPTIIFEIIKEFLFAPQQVAEVIKLLNAETGKYILSPTHRILRNRKWLIISPLNFVDQSVVIIEKGTNKVQVGENELVIQLKDIKEINIPNNTIVALLDADQIHFPLYLRRWKQGDYFYPLGMQKKKKLARFFIDQKLSLVEKEEIWVVECGKRIAWVVNYRIDDRFKITPNTKKVVQINWSSL